MSLYLYRWGYEPPRWPVDVEQDETLEATHQDACERGLKTAFRDRAALHLANETWIALLDLAASYAWQPTGPAHSPDAKLDAAPYEPDSGQLVTTGDAQTLADALERAREARDAGSESLPPVDWSGLERAAWRDLGEEGGRALAAVREQFAEDGFLEEFIAFCRGGAFRLG